MGHAEKRLPTPQHLYPWTRNYRYRGWTSQKEESPLLSRLIRLNNGSVYYHKALLTKHKLVATRNLLDRQAWIWKGTRASQGHLNNWRRRQDLSFLRFLVGLALAFGFFLLHLFLSRPDDAPPEPGLRPLHGHDSGTQGDSPAGRHPRLVDGARDFCALGASSAICGYCCLLLGTSRNIARSSRYTSLGFGISNSHTYASFKCVNRLIISLRCSSNASSKLSFIIPAWP